MLCDPKYRDQMTKRGDDPEKLGPLYGELINAAMSDIPSDMTVTMHLCRGNYKSTFMGAGGYEAEAEVLFNRINVHGYFMEYDTERAGGFEPLRLLPKGKTVVLGLVTTKTGKLESKDELKRRIDQAAKFCRPRPALPVRPVRLRLDRGGQHAHRGRAMGEAAPDRRGRRRGVGAVASCRASRAAASTSSPSSAGLVPAIHVFTTVSDESRAWMPGHKPGHDVEQRGHSARHRRRKSRHRHRRGPRHRPRHRAAAGGGGREGPGQRRRRGARRLRRRRRSGAAGGRRDQEEGRPGDRLDALDRRSGQRRPDRQGRARRLRPRRHPGQQRRHPARPDLPPHELVGLVGRDRGASARLVLDEPRRRRPFPRAELRQLHPHDLDLGPGRQLRPGQLHGGEDGHRRPVARHRARHAALQRALERASRRLPGAA